MWLVLTRTLVLLGLLLTVFDTRCYFTSTEHAANTYKNFDYFFRNCRSSYELQVHTQLDSGSGVQYRSLDWARDTYGDLLADFRCAGKHIYSLDIDWEEAGQIMSWMDSNLRDPTIDPPDWA